MQKTSRILSHQKISKPIRGVTRIGHKGIPSWVVNPGNAPDEMYRFDLGVAWKKSNGLIVPISTLLTTVRAAPAAYVNDNQNNWTAIGANLPRIGVGNGLLVEESRTNSIRNNSMQGAVVGTPGTAPTNWAFGGFTGASKQVVGFGTDVQGRDYIDLRIFGTSVDGSLAINLGFEATTAIAGTVGQIWSPSVWVALIAGTIPTGSVQLVIDERDAGNVHLVYTPSANLKAQIGSSLNRISASLTVANASTAFVPVSLWMGQTSGDVIDFTIRVAWPQMELGTSVTSPIRTTGAAISRAIDLVTLTTPGVFGAAYTDYAEGTPQSPNPYISAQNITQLDNGGDGQRLVMRRQTNGGILAAVVGGTGGNFNPVGTWTSSGKMAAAVAAGDQASAFNGGAVATNTAAVLPTTPTFVRFGTNGSTSEDWNGFIKSRAIWYNQRVPNAQLVSMTQ